MQNNSKKIMTEEGFELKPYPEEKEEITISIPKLTFEALEKLAERKDLPLKALLKFYIGQGMRQDLSEEEAKELALKRMKSRKDSNETEEIDLAA
jgi:hypothetical protein